MQILLVKKNRTTTNYVLIEYDNEFVYLKWGKVGKPNASKSTTKCGSLKEVHKTLEKLIKEYTIKGYTINKSEDINIIDFEVFDKAKWHLEGNFPIDIEERQAYVHTGMYIAWLVINNLISEELILMSDESISNLIKRVSTPVAFYENLLDGVFTSNDVNEIGYKFTKKYFDFENGLYLSDYENILASNLQTIFNVSDSWENYDALAKQISIRFIDWESSNSD